MRKNSVIFDITGVLFSESKVKLVRKLGIARILRYIIWHRKNPLKTCLEAMQEIQKSEAPDKTPIQYKEYSLPNCMHEWQKGNTTIALVESELNAALDDLKKQNFFKSNQEIEMAQRILKTMLDVETLAKVTKPIASMFQLVNFLKEEGYKLYIISNLSVDIYALLEKNYPDFLELFDGIVISGKVNLLKPDPDIFNYCLTNYNIDPSQALFIDDQEENIFAAQQVGIHSILFTKPAKTIKILKALLA